MKYLVALVVIAMCAICVHSVPLSRFGSKVTINDIDKEDIEKLIAVLEEKLEGVTKQDIIDIIFPPHVNINNFNYKRKFKNKEIPLFLLFKSKCALL